MATQCIRKQCNLSYFVFVPEVYVEKKNEKY